MWQENVTQNELQSNFAGLVSLIKERQNWVAMEGKTPTVPTVPATVHTKSIMQGQVSVRFTEFEFPFP